MKLTIVTTTYNQEKYIGKAIEGMLMQKTNFPFQIMISNDCSTDGTMEILNSYQEKYPDKIRVINREKNLGAMKNFICTLSQVKDSEYVALCDGDDFWTDEMKLQKQVDFLDNHKDFTICFHKARLFYEKNEKADRVIPVNIKEITTLEDLLEQNYIIANSVVYRWKFNNCNLEEIFPDNIVPGDYYVHLLHAQSGKIKMINEIMSAYRRHEKGMWWSQENENQDKFILTYGERLLNFCNVVDKNLNLDEIALKKQRRDIIYNMIISYVRNDKTEEVFTKMKSQRDKEEFQSIMKDIVNRNIWHLDYLAQREKNQKEENEKREREELLKCKERLEQIENSRWWKLRNKLKKG